MNTSSRKPAEYHVWMAMLYRCYGTKGSSYPDYGGRGIRVCYRWRRSFANFLKDMGPRPSRRHSIDRFPNQNGNYEPGNCRWATITQQTRNTRRNNLLTHDGKTLCLAEWSEITGINQGTLRSRRRLGWDAKRILTTFDDPREIAVTLHGKTQSVRAWCKELDLPYGRIKQRINKLHWTPERALTAPRASRWSRTPSRNPYV